MVAQLADHDTSLWNRKLLYWFQGGVAIGHSQGTVHGGSMNLDILKLGYAIVHSSGNNTGTHYNIRAAPARHALGGAGRGPVAERGLQDEPVLLLSLKADGVGLNPTAANTVIHLDPWWNPAVESQATDRVHRIGQDQPVFVCKLVVEGSIEERMLALQERRRPWPRACWAATRTAR